MRRWLTVWTVVLALVAVLAIANWQSLMIPVTLEFLIARLSAPLVVVLIGALASLTLVFLLWLQQKQLLQIGRPGSHTEAGESIRDVVLRLERVEEALKRDVDRVRGIRAVEADAGERDIRRAG